MKINSTTVTIVVISLIAVTSYYLSVVSRKTKSTCAAVESHPQKVDVNTSPAVNVPIESEATRPQKTVPQYIPTTVPDSILDDQLLQLRNNAQNVVSQISSSGLPIGHRNQLIMEYQQRYDIAKQRLLASKQQLAAIRQLHSQGTLDDVSTERAMWRVIGLPLDTVENISVPEPAPVLPGTHGVVTGLLLSDKTPMAVIDGKVVSVGQSIYGVKVVKIQDGYVEFDKSGVRWSQMVAESASSNWP